MVYTTHGHLWVDSSRTTAKKCLQLCGVWDLCSTVPAKMHHAIMHNPVSTQVEWRAPAYKRRAQGLGTTSHSN